MTRHCTIDDCTSKHFGKGYCQKHYSRVRRHGDPLNVGHGGRTPQPVAERIAQRSAPDGDCLIYQSGQTTRSGHVLIFRDGQYVGVHRAAWESANGPVPEGLCVCHHCDRPRCVNVEHLFLGTHADNNADRDRKGRHVALQGSKNGFAKLDEAKVAEIKRRLLDGASTYQLAAEYGVHQGTVWMISAGRTWRHVQPLAEVPDGHRAALAGCQWPDREQVTR